MTKTKLRPSVMACQKCGERQSLVVDSRAAHNASSIRRRRKCLSCGKRITTYELCLDLIPEAFYAESRQSFIKRRNARAMLMANYSDDDIITEATRRIAAAALKITKP